MVFTVLRVVYETYSRANDRANKNCVQVRHTSGGGFFEKWKWNNNDQSYTVVVGVLPRNAIVCVNLAFSECGIGAWLKWG